MAVGCTLTILEVCYEEAKASLSRQRDGRGTLY